MEHHLGDLQYAIMRELWHRGEATVADVHEALQESRGLALTTIATMLRKLEAKGVATHRVEGRQYVFRATVDEADVSRSMTEQLKQRVFGGDTAAMMSHLLSDHEVDASELDQLKALIAAKQREAKQHADK